MDETSNDNVYRVTREEIRSFVERIENLNIEKNEISEQQKDVLSLWHKQDSVDEIELTRTYAIANYQDGIANPFVTDSTLIRRIWFFNCYENVTPQELIEHMIGDNNYEDTIDINSDSRINIIDLIYILHREAGETAYFTCN